MEVKIEEHRRAAAVFRGGAINVQGRFLLPPASPEIIAEPGRLLQAATGHAETSASGAASATIAADLWRQLMPGSLVLAAGYGEQENLDGWREAIVVRGHDGELLVRWRDSPHEPRTSRSQEYIALLQPKIAAARFERTSRRRA